MLAKRGRQQKHQVDDGDNFPMSPATTKRTRSLSRNKNKEKDSVKKDRVKAAVNSVDDSNSKKTRSKSKPRIKTNKNTASSSSTSTNDNHDESAATRSQSSSSSSSSMMSFNVGTDEGTQQPIVFNIPMPNQNENPGIFRILQFIHSFVNIRQFIQYVLLLARSLAALSPWMFTFEITDELMLTFYVSNDGNNEDQLYEQLRIQPSAFGYYLRASLWAGYGTMLFNTWSLFSLPHSYFMTDAERSGGVNTAATTTVKTNINTSTGGVGAVAYSSQEVIQQYIALIIHIYLLIQLIFNLLLITPRIIIHLQCWSCTAEAATMTNGSEPISAEDSLEAQEDSLDSLRTMLRSDVWLAGRLLSRVQDGFTVLFLIIFQLCITFMKKNNENSKLYETLVSLCATGIFMVVLRVTVATLFSISCHDPAVLEEARKRGLSTVDIDNMKTFVYKSNNTATTVAAGCYDHDDYNSSSKSGKKNINSISNNSNSNDDENGNNTNTCSICLLPYEDGDELIALSCVRNNIHTIRRRRRVNNNSTGDSSSSGSNNSNDDISSTMGHVFHSVCIREWLHKQNACPLCQKLI